MEGEIDIVDLQLDGFKDIFKTNTYRKKRDPM